MRKYKFSKFWFKNIAITSILSGITTLTLTSCGSTNHTINPFITSFEDNEHCPNENDIVTQENVQDLTTIVHTGPINGYNIPTKDETTGFGYTGYKAFKYECQSILPNKKTKFVANICQNLNITIGKNTELFYKLLPDMNGSIEQPSTLDVNYPAENVIVDLLINDDNGTDNLVSLSSLNMQDENGYEYTPVNQGKTKIIFNDQWNSKHIPLGKLVGKHIHRIQLYYEFNTPTANETIRGWVDDIFIGDKKQINKSKLVNYVDTRRGTDVSWKTKFSRGSTIPITGLPNGFNFYTPFTSAEKNDWSYEYKSGNNINNLPTINGFSVSHMPSPWIGDYDRFTVMPQLADSEDYSADSTPIGRKIPFHHENEIAQPNYYGVTLDNQIKTEIAPNDHSAIFRFTFPTQQQFGALIFDSVRPNDQSNANYAEYFEFNGNTVSGYVLNAEGANNGATVMYIYGEFSHNFKVNNASEEGKKNLVFNLQSSKVVDFKFATSFISQTQAKRNLQMEIIEPGHTFNTLVNYATDVWEKKLSVIDLSKSNASQTQLVTMYSNIYRMNLYPNSHFENTNTSTQSIYQYTSPVLPTNGAVNKTYTNGQVRNGKMYVNNGFWDTYRTVWPLYQLLYPNFVNELIEGFLLEYRDSGWISRWSSPGHNDSMTGTSSDAAFSDAYVNGVIKDISTVINIYNSGIANAMQTPTNKYVGRKGLNQSLYLGYTPAEYLDDVTTGDKKTDSSADWSLQSYINDYALGQLALRLADDHNLTQSYAQTTTGQTKEQIKDTGNYLLNRSQNYQKIFWKPDGVSSEHGFFRGKFADGSWAGQWQDADNPWSAPFDPEAWGSEFVEEDGWNYAFSVSFDVPGLIELYGGQQNFLNKLDTFFNTPETGLKLGNYGRWGSDFLYAMEARDIRMGQLGMNNQPSHHIPYMYAAAGKPAQTQTITRAILERLFSGSDIGQGYLGDEDNGEMSSWYILSAMGLYPLALASGQYIITSPLFNEITIQRDNGNNINIKADDNNMANKYIKSMSLDGSAHDDTYISSTNLLAGNHKLHFKMTNQPTTWANKTIDPHQPTPEVMVSSGSWSSVPTVSDLSLLTDNDSLTSVNFASQNVELQCTFSSITQDKIINRFNLTSCNIPQLFNTIKLYASNNLDDRGMPKLIINNQQFKSRETKTYSFHTLSNYQYYWITFISDEPIILSQVSFLSN